MPRQAGTCQRGEITSFPTICLSENLRARVNEVDRKSETAVADLKVGHFKDCLLVRGIRRADVRMAQVLQSGTFFVAEAAVEIRIVQALIAGRLRHILQHTQLLLDYLLAIPRHLAPPGQYVVFDVLALLWRQAAPSAFLLLQISFLRRIHVVPLAELLANPALLIGRETLERLAVLQDTLALLR